MTKYQVTIYAGGDEIELDELYDTYEEAQEAANDWLSDYDTGCEDLHMSNPGDYEEGDPDAYYEIYEVEVDD